MSESNYRELFAALNYEFSDLTLLERGLTHRSKSSKNYERLEFLGDSVLGFTISAELYRKYPSFTEGKLTRLRASLVRKETLAKLGRKIRLGDYLKLGSGELKSGGHNRDSILADAVEALFGAVYLDSGIESTRNVILGLYSETLETLSPERIEKDPKTLLQEYLQKHMQALPEYETVKVSGVAHDQHFLVECHIPGISDKIRGEAKSRRAAEQDAASKAYDLLTKSNNAKRLS
ncbi:MAG: ribonuclease III [Gammaproteobacteria bacterium]|nr:ribonuclease III [Gammaproteobacteria bacterium]